MVHVAVVIIQQVEFQFLGPGCTIVEGQRIEIACSIYTEGAEPAVSSVAVEIMAAQIAKAILPGVVKSSV